MNITECLENYITDFNEITTNAVNLMKTNEDHFVSRPITIDINSSALATDLSDDFLYEKLDIGYTLFFIICDDNTDKRAEYKATNFEDAKYLRDELYLQIRYTYSKPVFHEDTDKKEIVIYGKIIDNDLMI